MTSTWFERAIFLSWYCATPDCTFCYMSTLKGKVDKQQAKRSPASVFAEAFLCKKLGWKIEFITAGTKALEDDEMEFILRGIHEITNEKHLLNFGALSKDQLVKFQPYIKGYTGTVECINKEVRERVCPTKPIEPVIATFKRCDELGLQKAITIIIGLGETKEDIPKLTNFIKEHNIDKVTMYALNPVESTQFEKGPEKSYYLDWIRQTKEQNPDLYLVAGPWINNTDITSEILEAGATSFTKFPVFKKFNSEQAKEIEAQIKNTGFEFEGSLTTCPQIDLSEIDSLSFDEQLKEKIKEKILSYVLQMQETSDKVLNSKAMLSQ